MKMIVYSGFHLEKMEKKKPPRNSCLYSPLTAQSPTCIWSIAEEEKLHASFKPDTQVRIKIRKGFSAEM